MFHLPKIITLEIFVLCLFALQVRSCFLFDYLEFYVNNFLCCLSFSVSKTHFSSYFTCRFTHSFGRYQPANSNQPQGEKDKVVFNPQSVDSKPKASQAPISQSPGIKNVTKKIIFCTFHLQKIITLEIFVLCLFALQVCSCFHCDYLQFYANNFLCCLSFSVGETHFSSYQIGRASCRERVCT